MGAPDFRLDGRVAVVTGATGVLGGAIARGLAAAGATVAPLARRRDRLEELAAELGGSALEADVLDEGALTAARDRLGRVDILVNAAGGNVAAATVGGERSFFDLPVDALQEVLALNVMGTLLPTRVFARAMGDGGSVVNVSSMAAARALTRVVGYGAAKAAVENLTRWLAVELAPEVRVNAIAPGFFLGEQNRALLLDPDGALTERGRQIVDATPFRRFGDPEEVVGAVVWLAGSASSFVTGTVVPVDGGFGAFSGV